MHSTPYHLLNGEYHIYNLTTELSAYGYVYYASLSTGESYAVQLFLTLLALFGVGLTAVMTVTHLCAIYFARHHMYRTTPVRDLGPCPEPRHVWQRRFTAARSYRAFCSIPSWQSCFRSSESASSVPPFITKPETLTIPFLQAPKIIVKMPDLLDGITQPSAIKPMSYPGVSIIKPLSGIDTNLEVNLASYFRLDYPTYEVLFCVSDSLDPSCKLVHRLQSIYPNVPSRLIVAKKIYGINPKINNLQAGYEAARYDLLLISDSGIWMRSDTLTDMVACLKSDANVGLVHQMPFMAPYLAAVRAFMDQTSPFPLVSSSSWSPLSDRPSFAWILQLVFFGCWHAKIYLFAAFLDINCVTGMSILLRKPVLSPLGGFVRFSRYLAEDFFISKYFIDQGWQIRLAHQPAWQNSLSTSVSQFHSRISRWSQLRLTMVIVAYILEPLSRCFPAAILGAFGFSHFLPNFIDPGVFFLCHILIWFLFDYILLLNLYPPCMQLCITKLEYLVAWIFSELTAVPFHFSVIFKRDIQWRNKRYRVHWGGVSEQIILSPSANQTDHLVPDNCAGEAVGSANTTMHL
ncbi:Ceramide glucosyltransferase [Clonorchis sinensis]|uniref:ceramide glucosyltransferase n=1 Tax=Clonorchis sinensis TaxID=79923 RepID=A0A3R7D3N1_CLOSI|nr:Ceramide glucosyltransferase [Clonorchis sinensis]